MIADEGSARALEDLVASTEAQDLLNAAKDPSLSEELALRLLNHPELPARALELLAKNPSIMKHRPVIAGASTHPGEEAVLIDVHRRLRHSFPGLLTILVPRHPERGTGIAEIARVAQVNYAQRSAGEMPRNSPSNWPPCTALSIAAACNVNTPRKPSR